MSINIKNYDKEKLLKAYNQVYGEKKQWYQIIDLLSGFNPGLLIGGGTGIIATGILAPIIANLAKSMDEMLTDVFYEKQLHDYWDANDVPGRREYSPKSQVLFAIRC